MENFRRYDPKQDGKAIRRIWREIGWLDAGKKQHAKALGIFAQCCDGWVATLDGGAECLALTAPGRLRHLREELSFFGVMAVTTSRVARKQGFARRLMARAVARGAAEGGLVAGLGMFEQGYYDRLGFGSGGYEVWLAFDPASLTVDRPFRPPTRISRKDWRSVHASRLARRRGHATVIFDAPEITRAEMLWTENGFGLGYFDGPGGELTHHTSGLARAATPNTDRTKWSG